MPEIFYPGVYVTELAYEPTSISGVTTSTDTFAGGIDAASLSTSGVPSPDWTDANASDPGISLLQLLDWPLHDLGLASRPAGIVSGLDQKAAENRDPVPVPVAVSVSAGLAVGNDGRTIEPDQRRISEATCRKPWP